MSFWHCLGSNNEHCGGNGWSQHREQRECGFRVMAPVLRMAGRGFQPECGLGLRDLLFQLMILVIWGGKKMYFHHCVSRMSDVETSSWPRNTLIWIFKLLHKDTLALPRGWGGWGHRAGQGFSSVQFYFVLPFGLAQSLVSSSHPGDPMLLISCGS